MNALNNTIQLTQQYVIDYMYSVCTVGWVSLARLKFAIKKLADRNNAVFSMTRDYKSQLHVILTFCRAIVETGISL